jgi:hypothetical protein
LQVFLEARAVLKYGVEFALPIGSPAADLRLVSQVEIGGDMKIEGVPNNRDELSCLGVIVEEPYASIVVEVPVYAEAHPRPLGPNAAGQAVTSRRSIELVIVIMPEIPASEPFLQYAGE